MALGIFKKLARGLSRTREGLLATLDVGRAETIDDEALEDLEAALLGADVGPEVTEDVLRSVREAAARGAMGEAGLAGAVRLALREAFDGDAAPDTHGAGSPRVIFVVGVNGGGKTTTVGKLAAREREAGRRVIVVAADTFRAAAIDQLETWAARAEAEVVKQREGSDPAAVVFDALRSARAKQVDTVIVDTAGRLHTKANLMAELSKLARVAGREVPGAPHEVLLIVDATTGQNGLNQAAQFSAAAELTGVVLTKLDGTAKGGVALAIRRRLGVPVRYVGVGEGLDDLLDFDAAAFVDGLLGATP